MRRPRVVVAGLVCAAVIAAGAVTVPLTIFRSNPAEAAVTAEQGELLAPLWDDAQHPFTSVGTSEYFAYRQDPWSGASNKNWQVASVADGHIVIPDVSSEYSGPAMAGKYFVKATSPSVSQYKYEYIDPATSESKGTVLIPDWAVCLHEVGVVFRTVDNDVQHLWIQQPDGAKRELATTPIGTLVCMDQDARHLLVKTVDDLRLIDVQTGASKTIAAVSPEWATLTPGRVFWRTGQTATGQQVAWADRDGQASGTVDVGFTEDLQTLGDDLLVLHKTAADYQYEVRRIAAADGAVSAPLLTDARGGTALDDGTFLVGRPTSLDLLSGDGGRREVMPLPRARELAWGIGMSGDRVVASWMDSSDMAFFDVPMSEITTTAGAEWTQPRTSIPGLQRPDEPFQLSGDVLVTTQRTPGITQPQYVVAWPGGHRDIPMTSLNTVRLGRGGRLLTTFVNGVGDVLQDARTGAPADAAVKDRSKTAIDGTWVWTGPDSTGILSGKDTSTGRTKTVQATVPQSCAPGAGLQVAGRWATYCGVVVDLLGVVPDRTLTVGEGWSRVLGDGFIASLALSRDNPPELLVTDLNDPDLPHRSYGYVAAQAWRDERRIIAEAGAEDPRFAYVDNAEQVRVTKVDWLKPAPPTTRADKTAPTLTSATAGPRTSPTQSIAFSYAFTDPTSDAEPASGVASYDVRIQQRTGASGAYGAWKQQWSATTATKVTMTAAPGMDTCFRVRATDKLGNVSPWSASQCSQVDGTKPTLARLSPSDRVRYTSAVKFTFSYKDNTQLGSYDVVYRTAGAGRSLGPWVFPAAWQKTKTPSVSMTVAGGSDTCFMVRARDAAGNLTAWSPQVCTSLPLDDRSLSITGSVTRATTAMGIYGTASRLNKPGAGLYRTGQVGNRIAVVALSGPGQGAVDVWHAGRKLGRISLAATSWSRRTYYLPVTPYASGTVSIVSASTSYAWIDGFTALRY
ncbi:hypothetical protein [Kribbella pratensis]|uniref:Uncharacterized protein n=1 Tax=Kribbella pratensis TaxID=2512112 RepID=A0A4R8CFY2_9ACTN|nr:hypothetical protein [Kribbella pratensis]TDW74964.1 hypothetical protein EV653_0074 [Kribbella pratensis]